MTDSTLNSLIIVARHRGVEVNIAELSRTYTFGDTEPPTAMLLAVASDLRLDARHMVLDWRHLPRIQKHLPAILRLRDGTALVLTALPTDQNSGQMAVVRDPTGPDDAQAIVDEARLAEVWDGDVILVKRRYSLTDEERPFGVSWVVGQVLRERKMFRDVVIAAIINVVLLLTPLLIIRTIVDRVLVNQSVNTLIVLAIILVGSLIFEMVLNFLRQLFLEVIATRLDGRLNLHIMAKLLKLPLDYFERNSTGKIASRLAKAQTVRSFLSGQLFMTILDGVTIWALLPVLFFISWQLTLIVLAWALIVFILVLCFLKPLHNLLRRFIAAEHEKTSYLVETVYGIKTIKSLVLEGRRRQGWDFRTAEAASARNDLGRKHNRLHTLTLPFQGLMYSGSVIIGAALILYQMSLVTTSYGSPTSPAAMAAAASIITPGLLLAFAMLASRIGMPLIHLAGIILEIGEVRGAIIEIGNVINVTPEETRAGTGLRLPIRGEIIFQNVHFRYSASAPLALDNVSFPVPAGSILGVMGRSGSGKTTITRLLQGLNPNYEGIIKVDSMDLREIDLHHLRTNIGVVAQENFLFKGTIAENIGMARPDYGLADVVRAAQLAGAEEFIEKMPRGYNTMLEESAANLSGGQRQRIAIARALILDPPVLILDEATSALDAESEAIINANLMRMAEGRTIIIVSHRLSMLVPAHSILVLDHGKLYDSGTHEELLHRCDIYRQMWFQQNRHVDQGVSHGPRAITALA